MTNYVFSHGQQVALTTIPVFTGLLSVIGSSCVVYIILCDKGRKLRKVYHRLLLGLSIADILNSAQMCFSSFFLPVGTPGVWLAYGNEASCTALGFFAQLGLVSTLYSGFLALYFYLIIQPQFSKKIHLVEPIFHSVSIGFPAITAIGGIFLDTYNPVPLGVGCWVAASPFGCQDDESIECESGENAGSLIMIFGGPPIVISAILVIGCMIAVYVSIRRQTRIVESRYSVAPLQNYNSRTQERIRQAGIQAGLYVSSYMLTYSWVAAARMVENSADNPNFFAISLLSGIFYPLQGFWNFLIYFRPRYMELKRKLPDETAWNLFNSVFIREGQGDRRAGSQLVTASQYGRKGVGTALSSSPACMGESPMEMGRKRASIVVGRAVMNDEEGDTFDFPVEQSENESIVESQASFEPSTSSSLDYPSHSSEEGSKRESMGEDDDDYAEDPARSMC